MPAPQDHIDVRTPRGASLVPDGCTFRVWAPRARAVYVSGPFNDWQQNDAGLLLKDTNGYWTGFVPGVANGTAYKFYVQGDGSAGYKRDPFARELTLDPRYPHCNCVVRDPGGYPWHDHDFRPPAFNDLVIYQFHVGVYYAVDAAGKDRRLHRGARFLDVLDRIEYLVDLGVNAIQPLPIVEFATAFGLGYNGTDYFAPEMGYAVPADELPAYLDKANRLLAARNQDKLVAADLASHTGQLKAMIDICHVYGLAVLLDVVYNHAGGDFGDESLYFFDRAVFHSNNDSLYFTDQDWAGGLVFAYWNQDVRLFLIENAKFFLEEYHVDGLRYDEVSVIDRFGGWRFCQDLTSTMRFIKPSAVQIAEFWNPDPSYAVRPPGAGGGGFDTVWVAGLRDAVRAVIAQASGGRGAFVDLNQVRDNLYPPSGFPAAWRAVQYLENHDLLLVAHSDQDKRPRIPALADPGNAHSWYARSRSRVATGLLLTAPGVPMLFMGEEFLEDKYWSDNPDDPNHLIYWDGLRSDKTMIDYLRFTRELLALRHRQPALRGERINVFHVHNDNRVLAFQRWLDGTGRDVVVVISLNESTYYGYRVGFPSAGWWHEVFNSDVYDNWVNPIVAGNGTGVSADGYPMHGLPASASLVIPANGFLVFARDRGD